MTLKCRYRSKSGGCLMSLNTASPWWRPFKRDIRFVVLKLDAFFSSSRNPCWTCVANSNGIVLLCKKGPVPNGTLKPRGLPLSTQFCDVMSLWLSGRSLLRSLPQCGLSRSADRGCIMAAKGALASTLLNAKMRNGTPYGLVDLMDMRTGRPL